MTVQELYNALAVVTGVGLLLFVALFVLWGRDTARGDDHDRRLRDHAERLAVIEAALRIGERDDDTAPMPAVHVADARTAVAAAREANAPRPVPYPRTEGRHRAS